MEQVEIMSNLPVIHCGATATSSGRPRCLKSSTDFQAIAIDNSSAKAQDPSAVTAMRFEGFRVRPLDASDLRAIEQHMLELTPLDRRARFLFQAKDTSIAAYARRLDPLRDILIGAFDSSERLIGFAGAHADEEFRIVEIGITIDEDYRGRSLGRRLVALAMELAFARGAQSVHFDFSPDNHKFTRLVNALGGRIGIPVGHVEISALEVRWKRWSLLPHQFSSSPISIRRMSNLDYAAWSRMRRLLWPDETGRGHDTAMDEILNAKDAWAFIAERPDATATGFAEVSLRLYTNALFASNLSYYSRRGYHEYRRGTIATGSVTVFMKKRLTN
jgi:RimJ/RimL family protein N-acetyltransferase